LTESYHGGDIRVRHARPGDAPGWAALRHALWPDQSPEELRAEAEAFFTAPDQRLAAVLVAQPATNGLVGFAELSLRPYAEDCLTSPVAFLEGWYVVPSARRHGVGGALVAAAEDWAREEGCREFASDTQFDNKVSIEAHSASRTPARSAVSESHCRGEPMAQSSNPRQFGVLGSGEVGQVLAKGLAACGYQVRIGTRSPEKLAKFSRGTGIQAGNFEDVAGWADAVVLAVLGKAALEAIQLAGPRNLQGKLVIDTTNPIGDEPPVDGVLRYFTGPNESLMERLQAAHPGIAFVKAFNSVGSALMVHPILSGGPPTMFYCGNNADAKAVVARLLEHLGWEGADMGSAVAARALEPLAQLWCIPGFRENDWMHAFRLLRV
jgi:predicted dinucleotide-binding enzyme/GNAT superfamily N-acetyltransferase